MKTRILCITLALAALARAGSPADLIRLYEEEVLAHDLYVELGKAHPEIRPFQNIPHSEERHRQVMAGILEKEGIAIPKPPEGRRFTTEGLDKTYRQWLEEGKKSEVDACRVGVRLEDHDIADLREARKSFPKHEAALARLEAASNNHFRAFHRNLTRRGGSYEPEALSGKDIETILGENSGACDCQACGCNEDGKPCRGGCRKEGAGKGQARGSGANRSGGQGGQGAQRRLRRGWGGPPE